MTLHPEPIRDWLRDWGVGTTSRTGGFTEAMIRYRNRSFHTGIIHHHGYLLLFYGDRYLKILKIERERKGPEGENVEPTTN